MRSLAFASFVTLLTSAGLAAADPAPAISPRIGLELGVGLDGGKIFCHSEGTFCNGFTEAGGGNLGVSYFLTPRFGLTADFWAMAHTENNFTFTHYINTVGVKWRPIPILTLTGGVGAAHATLDYNGIVAARATSDNGFAILGAASVDVIRSWHWALAVEARFGSGFYGDDKDNDGMADVEGRNVGVGAAFTYFGF